MEQVNQILTVATCGRVDYIAMHSIIRIEALSNYSKLFMSNGKTLVVAKVLKLFEKRLDEHCFVRTHKTHLVNMSFVQTYIRGANAILLLANGERIPVARNRKRQINSRSLGN